MGLNFVKKNSNMYSFITATWNTVKGECYHNCSYCYMKRWGKLNPVRFDEKELKEFDRDMKKYGEGQFIFVGSSNDMFAENIPNEWIEKTLKYCAEFDNRYLFQTKNPDRIAQDKRIRKMLYRLKNPIITTTIETNRTIPDIMGNSPTPIKRTNAMNYLSQYFKTFVTIEPIMDFDLFVFVEMIEECNPTQVNIGCNTSFKIPLPEPDKEKVLQLINEIQKFTTIHNKKNLKRLLI